MTVDMKKICVMYGCAEWLNDSEQSVSDCHTSDAREAVEGPQSPAGAAPLAPPLSIAPVESGAEVMIERDATTARSDGQLRW